MPTPKTLWVWGEGFGGELGTPLLHVSKPVQLGSATYLSVAQSFYNTFAVKTDGTLWSWGYSGDELGLGAASSTTKSSPVQIGALTNWAKVDANGEGSHVIALKTDGTLWAWGYNGDGQLGDGTTVSKSSPVQIGSDTDWESIAAHIDHSHAIKTNGTLWAWGYNFYGYLGDGTNVSKSSPIQIGALTDWAKISGGYGHTLAVKDGGTLWAWGDPSGGCLGDGAVVTRSSPVQIGLLTTWSEVGAGTFNSHAIKTDGTLWAWGENGYGCLGDGTTTPKSSPIQIGALTNWARIKTDRYTANAVKTDGTLWGWGRSEDYGQAGIDTLMNRSSPVQVGTATNWAGSLCLRRYNSRLWVLKTDGTLWFTGSAEFDPRGDQRDYTNAFYISPAQLGSQTDWDSVTGEGNVVAALKQNGNMFGWGGGDSASGYGFTATVIGDGEASKRGSPVQVGAQAWTKVEPFLGLRSDGTLWTWGNGGSGQLGNLTTSSTNLSPIQVGAASDWAEISATGNSRFAIKTGGTLWAWGDNYRGVLGDGTTANKSSPVQIGAMTNWAQVDASYTPSYGGGTCLALKNDGTLWSWGANNLGQLGDGTSVDKSSPVQIGALTTWAKISSGGLHSAAIKTDGTLWTWGGNSTGSLGHNNTTNRSSPVQVGSSADWSEVRCGNGQTLALKTDGTLWAWGNNDFGAVGDISIVDKSSPVQIGTAKTWTSIGTAGGASLAVQRVVSEFWTGFANSAETDQ